MLHRAVSLVVALVLAAAPSVAAACASVCLPGVGSGTHTAAAAATQELEGTAHAGAHHAGASHHQHQQAVAEHHAAVDSHADAAHHEVADQGAPPAPVRMVAPHTSDCCAGRSALSPAVPAARADLTVIPPVAVVPVLDTARALPLAGSGPCGNAGSPLHRQARPLVALRI